MYSENTINKLIHMGLYTEEEISEEEFIEHEEDEDPEKIYKIKHKRIYDNDTNTYTETDIYIVIDTHGITTDEIMMRIQLDQAYYLYVIKVILIFFAVLSIIGIIIGIFYGVNISN